MAANGDQQPLDLQVEKAMATYHQPAGDLTVERLKRLTELARSGQVSEVAERTIEKLFALEREDSLQHLKELEQDLAVFEQQYGMDSSTFYARYSSGELGDQMDFIEWASLVQMAENLKKRLALLDTDDET